MKNVKRVALILLGVCLLAGVFVSVGGCGGSATSRADREAERAFKEIDRALKDAWGQP
jgi:hypothetical protein